MKHETKYSTPGPWTQSAVNEFEILGCNPTCYVALVQTPSGHPFDVPGGYEAAKANARLIAAAPETQRQRDILLTACQLALEKLGTTGEYPGIADSLRTAIASGSNGQGKRLIHR